MESGRPPAWRLVIFLVVLGLTAGAFGALGLPRLAVGSAPEQWSLAAAEPVAAPAPFAARRHRCRNEERMGPLPFDYAR